MPQMKAARVSDLESNARTNVVADILEKVQRGAGIAQADMLRKDYISSQQVSGYLSLMTKNELLRYDPELKVYKMTRKGDAFLRMHRQMGEFIDLIDEEIGL